MAEYRTKGIILCRRNVGEADRLYSILSVGRGKITAKARGVRRVTSKQSGHLEPLYVTSFSLIATQGTHIIGHALVEEDFPSLHSELEKIGLASRIAELVDTLTEDNQPVPGVFELLLQALTIIEQSNIPDLPPAFLRIFELKLMSELGYQPELDRCVVGEEKYSSLQSYHFNIALGGLVCPDHQQRHPDLAVSHEAIRVLRQIVGQPLRELLRLATTEQVAKEIDDIGRRFLEYHLHPTLKSVKVAKDLQK
jgi:DNA repair protein RecO (recombination protein O)